MKSPMQRPIVAEFFSDDSGDHIIIRRGRAFSMRVKVSEAISLANQLVDIAEEHT